MNVHVLLITLKPKTFIGVVDSHTTISNEDTRDPEQVPLAILSQNMQPFKINFKNCVTTIGNYFENLILAGTTSIENLLYKQRI